MKLKPLTSLNHHFAKWCTLLVFALLATGSVYAQRQITGTVTDAQTGEALIGASVLVQGTSTGTVTDINGAFSLEASDGDVLVVSYTGYDPQEVTVQPGVSTYNLELAAGVVIDEVVVTGYATQVKKDLTGSVAVVGKEELTALPTNNVENLLQGRAAGVSVIADGRPGSPSRVRIRGFSSFQNNDPLYVVDGVPTQDIGILNPNDIESISVLKDAGAASIYGSRASNGVILVTTKQGSQGVQVNFNAYVGMQLPGPGPENLLNAQEFADLQWLVYRNDGTNEVHPIYGPSPAAGGQNPTLPNWAASTDWWDETTDVAPIQNYDLSLSGGNENAKFFGSLNYFNQQGIIIETVSRRVSARFNSEFNIKDRVTIGENLTVAHQSRGRGIGNLSEGTPLDWIYREQSIIPVYMTVPYDGLSHNFQPGDYGGTGIAPRLGNGSNPVAIAQRNKDDFGYTVRLIGNAYADVKILEGLNFRSTFGGTYNNYYNENYTFSTYEDSENVATPNLVESSGYGNEWVWSNTLTLDRDFGVHSLLLVAGYEAVEYGTGRGQSGQRAGYFSNAVSFRTLSNGAQITNASSFYNTPTTLVSMFARADYGFQDKYLLSATVRRDGSSRFGEANRWGVFPSVTAAWRITEEPFFPSGDFLSSLKIRGGYGTMGNQLAVSPQNAFFLFGGSTNTSNYDLNGTGTSSLQGFRPTRIGNPDAKWETNITTNVGFDATLFNNKLDVVFDWYSKKTEDLLFNPELPGTAGAASQPYINVAEMKNNGVDLQLTYRQNWSDFSFEGNVTFTAYNNEIVKIAEGVPFFDAGGSRIGSFNRNQPGHAMSEFYGYQSLGLFQSQSEVDAAPDQDGAEPGFFRFADLDGSGDIGPDDRTFIGDPNPDFTYGLNLYFRYKGFDLTAFLFGSQGNDVFNFTRWWVDFWPSFQGQKSTDLLYNSWTPDNPGATTPKASNKSNFSTNTQMNSYYVEDGSYARLKNLQLGYNFSPSVLDGLGLTSARIYVQGTNLFTLTDYSGIDPEIGGSDINFGVDETNYPQIKQLTFGINVGF